MSTFVFDEAEPISFFGSLPIQYLLILGVIFRTLSFAYACFFDTKVFGRGPLSLYIKSLKNFEIYYFFSVIFEHIGSKLLLIQSLRMFP